MEIRPKAYQFTKNGIKFCQILILAFRNCPKTCRIMPNWRNFAKSGHADLESYNRLDTSAIQAICSTYSSSRRAWHLRYSGTTPRPYVPLTRPVDVHDTSAYQPPQAHVQLTRPVDVHDTSGIQVPHPGHIFHLPVQSTCMTPQLISHPRPMFNLPVQ